MFFFLQIKKIFFIEKKAVHSGWVLSRQCYEWVIPENRKIGQIMTVLWEWGLEEALVLFWPSGVCQAAGFYYDFRLLIFKIIVELGREVMGIEPGTIPQISLFLLTFSYFSWVKALPIAAILWLISRALKRFILTFFLPVFSLFLWKRFSEFLTLLFFYYHFSVVF